MGTGSGKHVMACGGVNRRQFLYRTGLGVLGAGLVPGIVGASPSEPPEAVFSVRGEELIGPDGNPIKLKGWRICQSSRHEETITADIVARYAEQGLLGNAQAMEIWWTPDATRQPSEPRAHEPGVYAEEHLPRLLEAMRVFVRAGSWIVPSIRVSFDADRALEYTAEGSNWWEGWAHHKKVIWNEPVVVESGPDAGTYGNHGDRFFDWLDWIISSILEDEEIASRIAYWQIWHFFGHRHHNHLTDEDYDRYFNVFVPQLIGKFREHDPHRLLGISARAFHVMEPLLERVKDGRWEPWDDHNWVLNCGGYGHHDTLIDEPSYLTQWPESSYAPRWDGEAEEFDFQKYVRETGLAVHSQEAPGLNEIYRQVPIPEPQRSFLVGLLNLYNEHANGFTFHAWPPSHEDAPDESELFDILRKAFAGERVE